MLGIMKGKVLAVLTAAAKVLGVSGLTLLYLHINNTPQEIAQRIPLEDQCIARSLVDYFH